MTIQELIKKLEALDPRDGYHHEVLVEDEYGFLMKIEDVLSVDGDVVIRREQL